MILTITSSSSPISSSPTSSTHYFIGYTSISFQIPQPSICQTLNRISTTNLSTHPLWITIFNPPPWRHHRRGTPWTTWSPCCPPTAPTPTTTRGTATTASPSPRPQRGCATPRGRTTASSTAPCRYVLVVYLFGQCLILLNCSLQAWCGYLVIRNNDDFFSTQFLINFNNDRHWPSLLSWSGSGVYCIVVFFVCVYVLVCILMLHLFWSKFLLPDYSPSCSLQIRSWSV